MEEMEKAQAALDNPQYIKISIFSVIDKFFVESIIKYMAEKAEKLSNVEEVLGKLESFLPKEKSNVGVTYPVKEALNKITKDINTSNEVKEFIDKFIKIIPDNFTLAVLVINILDIIFVLINKI
mgnify:CR=1 FL=1